MTAFPKTRASFPDCPYKDAVDAPYHSGCAYCAGVEDALAELNLAERVIEAARALHEVVEMDESVGVCLTSRTESLALGTALAEWVKQNQ